MRITFLHDHPACGGQFQTRLAMLNDHPEKVSCPSCPMRNDDLKEALRRLGKALSEVEAAKADLDHRFRLRVIAHDP